MRSEITNLVLLFTASLLGVGCRPEPEPPVAAEPAASARSWSEQIAAVRSGDATRISVTEETIDDREFAELAEGCASLVMLEIDHADIPQTALQLLHDLPALRRLKLGCPVDDAGARHIAAVSTLEILNLPDARISDDGLAALAELPRLELLRLHSPHVTDAGLSHIARMDSLRFLHLIDVPITDAGLRPLHEMTQLESFYLDGGRCTDEGLRELLAALPELHFHKDQLHLPGDRHAHPH